MKNEKILIIGDTHTSGKREKAWDVACESIYKIIEEQKFDKTIILGDLFNSYPSILDRVMFSLFINKLLKVSKDILLIKGTDSHEFSQGIYNYEDILNLTNIKAFDELEINNFVFCHSEFTGLKYITGALSKSERIADKKKTYVAGHIHQPECSFNNVIYLGSVYKTSFSEINDKKRIATIENNEIKFIPIDSFPMYEIELTGKNGKVKAKGLKEIKEKEVDLKIKASTDQQSIGELHRQINKIKAKFDIEYYQEDIKINNIKTDIPENLNKEVLLKNFCKERKYNFSLVEKELVS